MCHPKTAANQEDTVSIRRTSSSSDRVERRVIVLHTDPSHFLNRDVILVGVLAYIRGISITLVLYETGATKTCSGKPQTGGPEMYLVSLTRIDSIGRNIVSI